MLSDTHAVASSDLSAYLEGLCDRHFAGIDIILHAGDIVDPALLHIFAPRQVYAVRGNIDPPGHPQKRIVIVGGMRIGLIHGWGPPSGLEARVLAEFHREEIDCLIYGHSHQPVCYRRDGLLLFNPGSPTDRRAAPYHSIGLLTIDGINLRGEIIPVPGP